MSRIWLRKPSAVEVKDIPGVGDPAPVSPDLDVGHSTGVVAFLRHDGCPFSENTVKQLRDWAEQHPEVTVTIVSHGDAVITSRWLEAIGGPGKARLIQDPERQLYALWGLGYVPFWHFGGPASLLGVVRLWFKGIHNRVASGTRWQGAGMFMVSEGRVVWQHIPQSAEQFQLPPQPRVNPSQ